MKTSRDPRHLLRIHIMKDLFAISFNQSSIISKKESSVILENINSIDSEIERAAPEWPINKINPLDLAILRLSIFELIIKKDTPFRVVVDESVELAKEYGSESSPSFINGVLGNIIKTKKLEKGEN